MPPSVPIYLSRPAQIDVCEACAVTQMHASLNHGSWLAAFMRPDRPVKYLARTCATSLRMLLIALLRTVTTALSLQWRYQIPGLILAMLLQVKVQPREVLFRSGEDSQSGIFIVVEGGLGVYLDEGEELRLTNILRTGESVGDLDVLDGMSSQRYAIGSAFLVHMLSSA